ncbi:hypothetical protein [Saccharothrix yanglingensis]|uniref:hypothetical protein n=1 Tax=Saccharothrix yanglingensis TaxID=659496 RepID=UPI0027D252BB|nr:hypothetical protein [Saccharothrix yanglingensis]
MTAPAAARPDPAARVVDEVARQVKRRRPGSPAHVVGRPARGAEEYLRHYAHDHADWAAVDNLMRSQGLHAKPFTPQMLAAFHARFATGHGTRPLIGSPDDIADRIARFHQSGFSGMTLSFVDHLSELDHFAQEVLPGRTPGASACPRVHGTGRREWTPEEQAAAHRN